VSLIVVYLKMKSLFAKLAETAANGRKYDRKQQQQQ
jgi:hypothetical protein